MKQVNLAKKQQVAAAKAPGSIEELEVMVRAGNDIAGMVVHSAVAGAILERWNSGNRRLDEVTVQRYRRDMEADRWLAGGEIAFGIVDGAVVLGNGQHRAAAQVASSLPQEYNVRVFTDADDFEVYVLTCDGGKNRTLADQLRIFGVAETADAASTFERTLNAMQNFLGQRAARLSKQERMDAAMSYAKSIRYVLGLPRREFRAHLLAAIAFAHNKKARATESFIAEVISGAELTNGSPALVLGHALPEMNAARDARAKDRAVARMIRAIHDGIQGKRKTIIARGRDDSKAMLEAITTLVSAQAAEAWVGRQGKRASR